MAQKKPDIQYIAIEHIHPHPDNPRKDLGDISELTDSIKKNGIMQNLTVIPAEKEGEYTALIGHRRLAAAQAAGLLTVPCKVVRLLTPGEQVAIMLEENMQRNDLTIIEQAQGFQMMLDLGSTEKEIAAKTGFSEQTVKHRLKIAQLDPKAIKAAEEDGYFQLTIKHFTMLEKLPDVEMRNEVLRDARDGRQLELKINDKLNSIEREKHAVEIIAALEEAGIKEASKNVHTWTSGYNTVTSYNLNGEPEKDVMKKLRTKDGKELWHPAEEMVYLREYSWLTVLHREPKTQRKEENKEQKYKDRQKKEVRALQKELEAERRAAILYIARGNYEIKKEDEQPLVDSLINVAVRAQAFFSEHNVAAYLYGGDWYSLNEEERAEYELKAKKLPMKMKLLILADNATRIRTGIDAGCIISWDGTRRPDECNNLVLMYKVLEDYFGCEMPEDVEQFRDGTHPLFRTYEEAKEAGDAE